MQFLLEAVLKLNQSGFNVAGVKSDVDGLKTSLKSVGDSGKSFDQVSQSAAKTGASIDGMGKRAKAASAVTAQGARGMEAAFGALQRRLATIAIGAKLGDIARDARNMALDVEAAFSKIEIQTTASADSVGKFRDTARDLSLETGVQIESIADAYFTASSAGLDFASSQDVVNQAVKLSAAGYGQAADLVTLASVAIKSYGQENITAAGAMDIIAATIKGGLIPSADQLSGVLSKLTPNAATLGVELDSTAGAVALLTTRGLELSQAGTAIDSLLRNIVKPTKEAQEALEATGVSMEELRAAFDDGIVEGLQKLEEAFDGNQEAIARFISDSEGARAANIILSASNDELEATFGATADAAGDAGEAYETYADTATAASQRASAEFDAALQDLGTAALPAITEITEAAAVLVSVLGDDMVSNINGVTTAFDKFNGVIPVDGVIRALGEELGFANESMGDTEAIVRTLVDGFGLLLNPIEQVKFVIGDLKDKFDDAFGTGGVGVSDAIDATGVSIEGMADAVIEGATATDVLADGLDQTADAADAAGDATQTLGDEIRTAFQDALDAPDELVEKLRLLQEEAEKQIELGVDADEVEDVLADLSNELLELTDKDWEAVLTSDTASFDDDIDRAILTLAGFEETQVTALLSGDAEQLNTVLLAAAIDLGLIDETVVEAALGADATALFATLNAALDGVSALDAALAAVELQTARSVGKAIGQGEVAIVQSITNIKASLSGLGGADLSQFRAQLDSARAASDNLATSASRAGGGARGVGTAAKQASGDVDELGESLDEVTDAEKEAAEAAEEYAEELEETIDAVSELADANQDLASTYDEVADAIGEAQDAIDSFNGLQGDFIDAESGFFESFDDLADQLAEANEEGAEFVNTLDLTTEAGRENTDAIREAVEAAEEYVLAQIAAGASAEEAGAAYAGIIDDIVELGAAMGLSEEEVRGLIEQIGLIPDAVLIEAEANITPAVDELEELRAEYEEIDGTTIEAVVEARTEQFRAEMAQVIAEATGLSEKEIIATLSADASPFDRATAEVILRLAEVENAEAIARLDADDVDLRTKLLAALVDLGAISETEARAQIRADFGDSAVKIAAFKDALNELRGITETQVRIANFRATMDELNEIKTAKDLVATDGTFNITSNLPQVIGEAEQLLTKADEATAPRNLEVGSNLAVVRGEAEAVSVAADQAAAPRDLNVGSNLPAVTGEANALAGAADTATADRNMNISTNAPAARADVNAFASAADAAVRPRTATINVVANGLAGLSAQLDSAARSRTAVVRVDTINTTTNRTITENVSSGIGGQTGTPFSGGNVVRFADGGIRTFANGGFNEAHITQAIHPAGIVRYAEPETGGEAFIPMGMHKRDKAVPVLSTVANNFDYDLIPRDGRNTVRSFFDGGFTNTAPPAGQNYGSHMSLSVDVGGLTITGNGAHPDAVVALVKSEVKQFERNLNRKVTANL